MTFCFVFSLPLGVFKSLEAFEEYEQTQEVRSARLADLKKLLTENNEKGVYVVVIGESTDRDHMHAFGYARKNTPWLDQMAKNPLTILYPHAYSNHTLTVQSLQYALTAQNQYQNIPLHESYSLTEVARAAGYETYWISNQKQFMRSDIPIATIAAATNHQVWINAHADEKTVTTYYDEKLAEYIPTNSSVDKALFMIHLMGCHSVYNERYSSDFDVFQGHAGDEDAYDNAILHNDYVLEKIYEKAQNLPHFMAFIYFSDHGEELRNKARHDPSKFTFNMTHIPLVMIFSEEFKAKHPDIFKELAVHKNSYVTSDLLYNALLSILGIRGLPYQDSGLDITSKQYRMNKDNLLTLYGEKGLVHDI